MRGRFSTFQGSSGFTARLRCCLETFGSVKWAVRLCLARKTAALFGCGQRAPQDASLKKF